MNIFGVSQVLISSSGYSTLRYSPSLHAGKDGKPLCATSLRGSDSTWAVTTGEVNCKSCLYELSLQRGQVFLYLMEILTNKGRGKANHADDGGHPLCGRPSIRGTDKGVGLVTCGKCLEILFRLQAGESPTKTAVIRKAASILWIQTGNEDTEEVVKSVAPRYGSLHPSIRGNGQYILQISNCFDGDIVEKYMRQVLAGGLDD